VTKTRRVELHIERREISLFATPGAFPVQAGSCAKPDGSGLMQVRPTACPTCGSPDLLPLADAVAPSTLDLAALQQGVKTGSVHLHRSASGEWWVCGQTFHPG
jgi:hypothetical protein